MEKNPIKKVDRAVKTVYKLLIDCKENIIHHRGTFPKFGMFLPLLNSVSYVAQQCCGSRIRIYGFFFKFRKGRVCSNPKCVKCTAKPCGKCRRCVNPASKNKCVNRYLTFTVFLVNFLQCCKSETKVSDPVSDPDTA